MANRFCFSTTVFDNLLVLSYFARGVLAFTECMLGLEPPKRAGHAVVLPEEFKELNLDPGVMSGQIIQISIPAAFSLSPEEENDDGSMLLTMGQIFDLLLVNYEAVVVAVYRAGSDDLPYVAFPSSNEEIKPTDLLFVVAPPHQIESLLKIMDDPSIKGP